MSFLNDMKENLDILGRGVEKTGRILYVIMSVMFFLVGLIICVMTARSWVEEILYFKNGFPVTAVVSDMEYNSSSDFSYYVDYSVYDLTFEHIYVENISYGYSEGDEIELYANPQNYGEVRMKYNSNPGYLIMFFFGAFFMAVTFWSVLGPKFKHRIGVNNRLKDIGECRYLPIKRIEVDYNILKNNEHPHWVICEEVNTLENTVYLYRSPRIYSEEVYNLKAGDKVAVYIHPKNPDKYFMDLNDVMPADMPF